MNTENKFIALSYTLTVDGAVVESVPAEQPLSFVSGLGRLLPKFEANVVNLEVGGTFEFTLEPAEGYGELIPDAVVTLPKSIFEVDGKFDEEMVCVGNVLPMMDNQGNKLMGNVKEVSETEVVMDFNHPMAGKTLNFTGTVVETRPATEDEISGKANGCGCGCGDSCDSEGGCGCEGDCGDSGCCN